MTKHQNINQALNAVQEQLKAPKNQKNNFGNYNYRSAEDILEAVKPLLFANELTMTISDDIFCMSSAHKPEQITYKNSKGYDVTDVIGGDRFYVKSTVTLYFGEKSVSVSGVARESQYKAGVDDSQITGSTSSYARKYALNGMFAIDDTKDADSMDNSAPKQLSTRKEQPKADSKGLSATPKQIGMLFGLAKDQGYTERAEAVEWLENQALKSLDSMTTAEANKLITTLMEAK